MRHVSRLLVVVLASHGLVVSCGGSDYALPDRDDAEVQTKEAELVEVISAAREDASCEARLLGDDGDASFVWAECFGPTGGVSTAMRVEGDSVEMPDQADHSDSVRELFPDGLVDRILESDEQLKP